MDSYQKFLALVIPKSWHFTVLVEAYAKLGHGQDSMDKIAIDLVIDLIVSTSGNQHILTIIDHLTGWPEPFPIQDKKADTSVHVQVNNYLPIYRCPYVKLSNNRTEFKNQLMDNALQ